MVLTYEYDDYRNRKSDSNSDYEPKDDDGDVLGARKLLGGTYICYAFPEAKILFAERLVKNVYDSILDQISICNEVHNGWPSIHHVIDG